MEMDDSLADWLQSLCNGRTERSGISVWFYILRRFCSPIAAVCRRIVRIALGLLGLCMVCLPRVVAYVWNIVFVDYRRIVGLYED